MLRLLLCGFLLCTTFMACSPSHEPLDPGASSDPVAATAEEARSVETDAEPAEGEDMSLAGKVWLVDEISGESITIPADARQPFIEFDGENASGYAGCNTFRGTYTVDGATLKFGPMISTKKACGGPLDEIEFSMHQALGSVTGFTIADGALSLTGEDGVTLLRATTRNP